MSKNKFKILSAALLSFTLLTGFGLKDVTSKIKPDTSKCDKSSNKKKCMQKEHLKTAAKIAAVTVAAKLLTDLIIEYRSKRTASDMDVAEDYKKDHKKLPKKPKLLSYTSSLKPGQVVKTGKPIAIESEMNVVPGRKRQSVLIQELIEIYDNEQTDKVIKSLVKDVNKKDKQAGSYENSFKFTLPAGMPQGVYRIRTAVLINKKEIRSTSNDMQVVFLGDKARFEQFAMNF